MIQSTLLKMSINPVSIGVALSSFKSFAWNWHEYYIKSVLVCAEYSDTGNLVDRITESSSSILKSPIVKSNYISRVSHFTTDIEG